MYSTDIFICISCIDKGFKKQYLLINITRKSILTVNKTQLLQLLNSGTKIKNIILTKDNKVIIKTNPIKRYRPEISKNIKNTSEDLIKQLHLGINTYNRVKYTANKLGIILYDAYIGSDFYNELFSVSVVAFNYTKQSFKLAQLNYAFDERNNIVASVLYNSVDGTGTMLIEPNEEGYKTLINILA